MGRKSKLTEDQWAELFRRVCEGESRRALADEFGLAEASIRQREAKIGKTAEVQQVARMMVDTHTAYESLPRSAQINAHNLAQKLISITSSLASAAELGAKTAHRLHSLANSEVNKVDDANPLDSIESLKGVGILTKLANDSSHIAINLLAANKEAMKPAETDDVAGALAELADRLPT